MSTEVQLTNLVINRVDTTETYNALLAKGSIKPEDLCIIEKPSVNFVKETNKNLDQRFWRGTKSEYDAIATKSADTMYIVVDDNGSGGEGEGGEGGTVISETEIYFAEYGVTTCADIAVAFQNGKALIAKSGNSYASFVSHNGSTSFVFYAPTQNKYWTCNSSGGWSSSDAITASSIGAASAADLEAALGNIPTPDVSGQINTHNGSTTAHSDIRAIANNAINTAGTAQNAAVAAIEAANEAKALADEKATAALNEAKTYAGELVANSAKVIHIGTTAPTNTNLLWVDTANGLKYHNGTAWVTVPVAYN